MNYERIYKQLVSFAQARETSLLAFTQNHHILPRALGGTDEKSNLVSLTAREHFLAHWLLYKMHGCPATARAFRLMANDQGKRRGRSYEEARQKMSEAMRGELNVSKRPEVRAKLKANCNMPFLGVPRPEHAQLLKDRKHWVKENNFRYGKGDEQRGEKNPYAVPLLATHEQFGQKTFVTQTEAARFLGVSQAAIFQALNKQQRSKGWSFQRIV